MTKRQRADWFKYDELEKRLEAYRIPDGIKVALFLKRLPPFSPVMLKHHDVRCAACDILCQVGDTVFTAPIYDVHDATLCYSCGLGWEIFNDRLTIDQAATIPAIGGPTSS